VFARVGITAALVGAGLLVSGCGGSGAGEASPSQRSTTTAVPKYVRHWERDRKVADSQLREIATCMRQAGFDPPLKPPYGTSQTPGSRIRSAVEGTENIDYGTGHGTYWIGIAPSNYHARLWAVEGMTTAGLSWGGEVRGSAALVAAHDGGGSWTRFSEQRRRVIRCAFSTDGASGPRRLLGYWHKRGELSEKVRDPS
jgi:hypothetical protein